MPNTSQKSGQNYLIFFRNFPGQDNVKRSSFKPGDSPAKNVSFSMWNFRSPSTNHDRTCQLPYLSISVSSSCLQRGPQHSVCSYLILEGRFCQRTWLFQPQLPMETVMMVPWRTAFLTCLPFFCLSISLSLPPAVPRVSESKPFPDSCWASHQRTSESSSFVPEGTWKSFLFFSILSCPQYPLIFKWIVSKISPGRKTL